MDYRYISISNVLDKVLRHPMLSNITFETIVDYTIDFMRIVGSPGIFEDKVVNLDVKDYAAVLPDDYYDVTQIKYDNTCIRYSTDTFHLSKNRPCNDLCKGYTYKIQDGVIFTSFKEGTIELSYKAIKTDEKGFPLIPDNSKFTRALIAYIKKEWFTILADMNKITPNSLQQAQQDYAWAVGACENEFQRLTLDKAESFYNSWRTMLIRDHQHEQGFVNNGNKQKTKF